MSQSPSLLKSLSDHMSGEGEEASSYVTQIEEFALDDGDFVYIQLL